MGLGGDYRHILHRKRYRHSSDFGSVLIAYDTVNLPSVTVFIHFHRIGIALEGIGPRKLGCALVFVIPCIGQAGACGIHPDLGDGPGSCRRIGRLLDNLGIPSHRQAIINEIHTAAGIVIFVDIHHRGRAAIDRHLHVLIESALEEALCQLGAQQEADGILLPLDERTLTEILPILDPGEFIHIVKVGVQRHAPVRPFALHGFLDAGKRHLTDIGLRNLHELVLHYHIFGIVKERDGGRLPVDGGGHICGEVLEAVCAQGNIDQITLLGKESSSGVHGVRIVRTLPQDAVFPV